MPLWTIVMLVRWFYMCTKVCGWYIDPNGIKIKVLSSTHTMLVSEIIKLLFFVPTWYHHWKDNTSPTLRRGGHILTFSKPSWISRSKVSETNLATHLQQTPRELGFSCFWLSLLSNLVLVQLILLTRGHSILLHIYVPYKTREGGWVHFPQPCFGLAIILSRSMSFLGKKVNNHK